MRCTRSVRDVHDALSGTPWPSPLETCFIEDEVSCDDVPEYMKCPISLSIMQQPVITPSGHTYDFQHLKTWLLQCPSDPLSGRPLRLGDLVPNFAIRQAIESFCNHVEEQTKLSC